MNFDEPATNEDTDHPSQPEGDRLIPPKADRPPTPAEEAAAERAAAGVDLTAVSEHEQEMAERGKNVEGEGQIE